MMMMVEIVVIVHDFRVVIDAVEPSEVIVIGWVGI